jgi:hypothetical protein
VPVRNFAHKLTFQLIKNILLMQHIRTILSNNINCLYLYLVFLFSNFDFTINPGEDRSLPSPLPSWPVAAHDLMVDVCAYKNEHLGSIKITSPCSEMMHGNTTSNNI